MHIPLTSTSIGKVLSRQQRAGAMAILFATTLAFAFLVLINGGALASSTAPQITSIPNQTIEEDGVMGPIEFTISDSNTPLSELSVTYTSTNLLLVPLDRIFVESIGDGSSRTIRILPAPERSGTAMIIVMVTDGREIGQTSFMLTVTNVDDPPTITSVANQEVQAGKSSGPILMTLNDVDTALSQLSLTVVSGDSDLLPPSGLVLGGSAGSRTLDIRPPADVQGTTVVTLTVSDASSSVSVSFNVTVVPPNQPPFISAITNKEIFEDETITVDFTVSDQETPENLSPLALSSNQTLLPNANMVLGGSGANRTLQITPKTDRIGQTDISISINDGEYVVTSTFRLTVLSVNDPPTISDIPSQSMNEDTVLEVPFTFGDVDNSNDQLSVGVSVINSTVEAEVKLKRTGGNGTITITPEANQSGSMVLLVTVSDGTLQAIDTFIVEVRATNDLPSVVSFGAQSTLEDKTFGPYSFVVQDVDSPIETLVVTASSSDQNIVPNASIILTRSESVAAQWIITAVPLPNAFGNTNITLRVEDEHGGVGTFQFRLTVEPVNDRPVISDIPDVTTPEDTPIAVDFVASDVETSAVQLLYQISSSNPALLAPSNAQVSNTISGQRLNLQPTANMFGTSTITVTVSDGKMQAATSFLFTVTPVNDAPILSQLPDVSTAENMTATLTFNMADPDNDLSDLSVNFASSNTLLMPVANIKMNGTESTRQLVLTPGPNLFGTATITMTVSDGSENTIDSFVLTVHALPTISPIAQQTVAEDESITVPFTIDDRDTPLDRLQLSADSSDTALVPRSNLIFQGTGNDRTLRITPAPDMFGTGIITITINDGTYKSTTAFQLVVTPVDDGPTIEGLSDQIIDQNGQLVLVFKIFDIDSPQSSITVTPDSSNRTLVPVGNIQISGSSTDRTLTVRPVAGRSGVTRIILSASDGTNRSEYSFELKVNGAPVFGAIGDITMVEDTVKVVNITVSDPDNPAADLLVSATVSDTILIPSNGVQIQDLGATRVLTITPGQDSVGTTVITLTLTDGRISVDRGVRVTILPVNDAPVISTIGDQIIDEDTIAGPIPFTIDDVDNPVESLTVYGSSSDTKLVPHTNIVFDGSGNTRSVRVRPLPNLSGQVAISITVSDGNLLATSVFSLTVRPVNDPPTIEAIGPQEILEDQTITLTLRIDDIDSPIDELTLSGRSANPGLVADHAMIFSGTGKTRTLVITPEADQAGAVSLSVLVSDGSLTAGTTFTLTVINVNDAPIIEPIEDQSIDEDTTLVLPLRLHDIDTPPDLLTLKVTSSDGRMVPTSLIQVIGKGLERTLVITPTRNRSGVTRIDLTLDDGELSDAKSFLLTVFPVNDPPTAVDDVYTIITMPEASFGVLANDFDVDRDPIKVIAVSEARFGEVSINRDNTILFKMPPEFVGQDVFTYTISDPFGLKDTAVVTVNVVEPPGPNTPEIYEVDPPTGLNDRSMDITISGVNLEPGAVVQLGPYPLSNVRGNLLNTKVTASVPAFLPPGRYDVIVINPDGRTAVRTSAFTVETDKIALISVRPNRGQIDLPVQINVYGLNFDTTATAYINDMRLQTSFINNKHLQAIVPPDTLAAGRHALTVINQDGQKFTVAEAYTAYTFNSDDLFAYDYEMWSQPATLHTGQSVQLGLHVRRQVGTTVLVDVEVDFYINTPYNEDAYIGRAMVPLLLPSDDNNSSDVIWTPPAAGSYTIFAVLDPRNLVPEVDETNNMIRRTVTVLPTKVDMAAPTIRRLVINDDTATTQSTAISVTVDAADSSTTIRAIYLVEYEYIRGADQWVPVQWSDWLTYTKSPETYSWHLLPSPGIKYIQAWAADERGNAMSQPALAAVNYVPVTEDWVDSGEVRLYRYTMEKGDRLSAFLFPTEGDPDLYVWPPDYELRSPWITNLSKGVDEVGFVAPKDGPYQLEILGHTGASYRTAVELRPQHYRSAENVKNNIDPNKTLRTEPFIPVFDMPAVEYRLSSTLPPREIEYPYFPTMIFLPSVEKIILPSRWVADATPATAEGSTMIHSIYLPWTSRD
ncbi:tandem-95 repeat protein [bacterium]|nr:tandem-95 repeat protein [bacterium]